MAEEAKMIRRTAKTRFTRKRNELLMSIASNRNRELIEANYAQLVDSWNILESKHDLYTMYLMDDEVETAEAWIAQVQETFTEATTTKIDYLSELENVTSRARAEAERAELQRTESERNQRIFEQRAIKRDTTRITFETLHKNTTTVLESEEVPHTVIKKFQLQLEEAVSECKQANLALLEMLTREATEAEMEWFPTIQTMFDIITEKLEARASKVHPETKPITKGTKEAKQSPLLLEKVKMPHFDGEIRQYPRFKSDFEKQVMPIIDPNNVCYVLRSCLGKDPATVVKSIDDDAKEIWRRLDERYGDPARVADVIINEILKVKQLKEGENQKFIDFVCLIEDGFKDLKRLGLERELTTTSSVSVIEKRLPQDIRREWAKLISSGESTVDKIDKFPSLMKFLIHQKEAIEYECAELRVTGEPKIKPQVHYAESRTPRDHQTTTTTRPRGPKCLLHDNANHWTDECKLYLSKTVQERYEILKNKGACFSCLRSGHRTQDCKRKRPCGMTGCTKEHHKTLHQDKQTDVTSTPVSSCDNSISNACLLLLQRIPTRKSTVNVMWDNGASVCFITNDKAKEEKLIGEKAELSIVKVGGQSETLPSRKFKLPLIDKQGKEIRVSVYGIDRITSDIKAMNLEGATKIFNIPSEDITRPVLHPEKEKVSGHLLLLKNRFGRCIGGTHPLIKEGDAQRPNNTTVHHLAKPCVESFYEIENVGIACKPRCGSCKCGRCPIGSKEYSIKEEKELELITKNLQYDNKREKWIAEYPRIRDPSELPNNERAAYGKLISTEKRLSKNPDHTKVYQAQIEDMVDRGVARKLTQQEIEEYKGPIHYISHHEVLKPDSKSTPVRIVFNSSASYMGHTLNEYWAKGPDLLNNLLGVLIRFREQEAALIGDVKKMYHTVETKQLDHHTHRFLWRDMQTTRKPDTYVI